MVDLPQLEEIGENLRNLGHERREAVERVLAESKSGDARAMQHYQELDRISEQAISLMERQRGMIREELAQRGQM